MPLLLGFDGVAAVLVPARFLARQRRAAGRFASRSGGRAPEEHPRHLNSQAERLGSRRTVVVGPFRNSHGTSRRVQTDGEKTQQARNALNRTARKIHKSPRSHSLTPLRRKWNADDLYEAFGSSLAVLRRLPFRPRSFLQLGSLHLLLKGPHHCDWYDFRLSRRRPASPIRLGLSPHS